MGSFKRVGNKTLVIERAQITPEEQLAQRGGKKFPEAAIAEAVVRNALRVNTAKAETIGHTGHTKEREV